QELATRRGLRPCFTAAYSPASNGMAEALVASFKRDYVYVNDCESADLVLSLLPSWFADYNEQAPHSALAMRSPREYRRALNLVGECQLKTGAEQGHAFDISTTRECRAPFCTFSARVLGDSAWSLLF